MRCPLCKRSKILLRDMDECMTKYAYNCLECNKNFDSPVTSIAAVSDREERWRLVGTYYSGLDALEYLLRDENNAKF